MQLLSRAFHPETVSEKGRQVAAGVKLDSHRDVILTAGKCMRTRVGALLSQTPLPDQV